MMNEPEIDPSLTEGFQHEESDYLIIPEQVNTIRPTLFLYDKEEDDMYVILEGPLTYHAIERGENIQHEDTHLSVAEYDWLVDLMVEMNDEDEQQVKKRMENMLQSMKSTISNTQNPSRN